MSEVSKPGNCSPPSHNDGTQGSPRHQADKTGFKGINFPLSMSRGLFYYYGLILVTSWVKNHSFIVWGEIIDPFPKYTGMNRGNYLSMLILNNYPCYSKYHIGQSGIIISQWNSKKTSKVRKPPNSYVMVCLIEIAITADLSLNLWSIRETWMKET